jgi:hypothetical protein
MVAPGILLVASDGGLKALRHPGNVLHEFGATTGILSLDGWLFWGKGQQSRGLLIRLITEAYYSHDADSRVVWLHPGLSRGQDCHGGALAESLTGVLRVA